MNEVDLVLIVIAGVILFYSIAFLLVRFLFSFSGRKNDPDKRDRIWLVTNIVLFLFFLLYGLIDIYLYVTVLWLEILWYFIIPLSFLGIIMYSRRLISKKTRNKG